MNNLQAVLSFLLRTRFRSSRIIVSFEVNSTFLHDPRCLYILVCISDKLNHTTFKMFAHAPYTCVYEVPR